MFQITSVLRGPINPEDLEPVPGTPWVLTSGMLGPTAPHGHLYFVDTRDGSCREAFPYATTFAPDEATYGAGQTALDPVIFEPHGLDVVRRADGELTAYVVNHGGQESVEVFQIVLDDEAPRLVWVGSLTLPHGMWGNDVAALQSEDGFVVSSSFDISESAEVGFQGMAAGKPNGAAAEWTVAGGWKMLPGGELNSPNGIAVSADGRWVYLAGWASKCLRRFSRGGDVLEQLEVPCDVMIDNITWSEDGRSLLAAGAFETDMAAFAAAYYGADPRVRCPTKVWRFDAETLESELVAFYGPEEFGVATTALEVGNEIWLGSMRFDGVARLIQA